MMMQSRIGIATLFAIGLAAPAQAAPLATSLTVTPAGVAVETVAYGCGRGFAPDGYGRCRPMYRAYGYRPRGYGYYGYGPDYYAVPGVTIGVPGARVSFY